MRRCLQLARLGLGSTYPNPMVGCVIVLKGKIIGEGWHRKAGDPHAEVNAIESVRDKSLLKKATIYVSLEPCSHFGKTPPCADRIISEGIPKVVVGSLDPNPKVAGSGIQKLKNAGCKVKTGILENECDELNKRFFTFHRLNRPYVILKWAETKDGFIAPSVQKEQRPVWITNPLSRQRVHKLRAEEQAILVGTQTAINDNPELTVRDWIGQSPLRVLIDRNNEVPMDQDLFNQKSPLLIFTEKEMQDSDSVHYITASDSKNLSSEILKQLYELDIQSLIVEGGARTLQSFIDANLWDEASVYVGDQMFVDGLPAPQLEGLKISEEKIKNDTLTHYINTNN